MKTYTITGFRTYDRFPGVIYAKLIDNDDDATCISATLEYIIEAIKDRGYTVTNYKHIGDRK